MALRPKYIVYYKSLHLKVMKRKQIRAGIIALRRIGATKDKLYSRIENLISTIVSYVIDIPMNAINNC